MANGVTANSAAPPRGRPRSPPSSRRGFLARAGSSSTPTVSEGSTATWSPTRPGRPAPRARPRRPLRRTRARASPAASARTRRRGCAGRSRRSRSQEQPGCVRHRRRRHPADGADRPDDRGQRRRYCLDAPSKSRSSRCRTETVKAPAVRAALRSRAGRKPGHAHLAGPGVAGDGLPGPALARGLSAERGRAPTTNPPCTAARPTAVWSSGSATPCAGPDRPTSPATHALLRHLAIEGFDGAPRFLGVDSDGSGGPVRPAGTGGRPRRTRPGR